MSGSPVLALDHVVVGAATLTQGVDWCCRTFGIEPAGGGKHGFMATHNRLFSIASTRLPQAYFEVIAVDPLAPAPGRTRWFDLDDPDVRDLLDAGPRLLTWVARCDSIASVAAMLRAQGCDPGEIIQAERETPSGPLRWQITVPADGRRLGHGAVPTLIQWGEGGHPADRLPSSSVTLARVTLGASHLGQAAEMLAQLSGPAIEIAPHADAAPITLVLDTPQGAVTLESLLTGR